MSIKNNYEIGKFSDIALSESAKVIWKYLNERETIIRLETASDLKRPALEAIARHLLNDLSRYEKEIRSDRYKQMIGHMVRQVMENNGYSIDQIGVRIPKDRGTEKDYLFTNAARYKRNV
jgi:hypothetical protein